MLNKINVVGLGKLGACSAVCLAHKGFKIMGYDINQETISLLKKNKAHIVERDFQNYLSKTKKNLIFTNKIDEILKHSDTTFIIVPTPSKKDHTFDNSYIIKFLTEVSLTIKKLKIKKHHFVINSTVMPTSCEKIFIPLIEKNSSLKYIKDFTLSYNPEFIALGSVINDFLNPDMILIGESSKKDGDKLEYIYNKVCNNKPVINRMSLVSAEITKISLNAFVTMKISFANSIKNICLDTPGSNPNDITKALGSDKRISPLYIKPGLPFAGPCFPRDNKALISFISKKNEFYHLAKSTDIINELHKKRILKIIKNRISKNKYNKIGIFGIAFKDGSNVIEQSITINILDKFPKTKFYLYDTYFNKFNYSKNSVLLKNKNELLSCDLIIINHILNSKQIKFFKNKNIIDLWN